MMRTRFPDLRTLPSSTYRTPIASDLAQVRRFSLVGETRIAGDDEQPRQPRDRCGDVLDQTVDKIFLLGVAAHVLKRQYYDRRLVG
jgi:hypothetical protein